MEEGGGEGKEGGRKEEGEEEGGWVSSDAIDWASQT
jgi:hypothetical protein